MATTPSGDALAWLETSREAVVRRALALAVERSSLAELAERPLGERVRDVELALEAARLEAARGPAEVPRDRLVAALEPLVAGGGPIALALLATPGDGAWEGALAAAAGHGERVLAVGGAVVAAIVPAASTREARAAADRLRASAWAALGGAGVLPDVGIAVFPDDGDDARALIDAARAALPGDAATRMPGDARALPGDARALPGDAAARMPGDAPVAGGGERASATERERGDAPVAGGGERASATERERGDAAERREAALRRALARFAEGEGDGDPPPGDDLPPVTPLRPR